jgi:hypothetical protein
MFKMTGLYWMNNSYCQAWLKVMFQHKRDEQLMTLLFELDSEQLRTA